MICAARIIESLMRTSIQWLAALNCVLFATNALAVMQPSANGPIIVPTLDESLTVCAAPTDRPEVDKNVQPCLDAAEGAAGSVDAQLDALIAPETFFPNCAL